MRIPILIVLGLSAFPLQAQTGPRVCSPGAARYIVEGIDVSGSYKLTVPAILQTAALVEHEGCPGDTWFVRRINDRSYDDSATMHSFRLPGPWLAVRNAFDRRQKEAAALAEHDFLRARVEAVARLREANPGAASMTDFTGFIAKAGELLAKAPEGSRKVLLIASDMVDTLGRTGAINLKDVAVVVMMFQGSANIDRTQRLKKTWEDRFRKLGASSVRFLDPDETAIARGLLSAP
jgi:hypothetical protein